MPFQISLIINILNMSLILLAVSTLAYAFYDTWKHKDPLEFLLRVLAISSGILIVGVSFFSNKPIPEIITEALINNVNISIKSFIYIYVIPIFLGGGVGVLLINIFNEQSVRSIRTLLFIMSMIISFFYGSLSVINQHYDVISDDIHKKNIYEFKKCESKLITDCKITKKHKKLLNNKGISRIPKHSSVIYEISYDLLEIGINKEPSYIGKQPYKALSPNIIFLVSLILYLVVMFKNPKLNMSDNNESEDTV